MGFLRSLRSQKAERLSLSAVSAAVKKCALDEERRFSSWLSLKGR